MTIKQNPVNQKEIVDSTNYGLIADALEESIIEAQEYTNTFTPEELAQDGLEVYTKILENLQILENKKQIAEAGNMPVYEANLLSQALFGENIYGEEINLSKSEQQAHLLTYMTKEAQKIEKEKQGQLEVILKTSEQRQKARRLGLIKNKKFQGEVVGSDYLTVEERILGMPEQLRYHGFTDTGLIKMFQDDIRHKENGLNYDRMDASIDNLKKYLGDNVLQSLANARIEFLEKNPLTLTGKKQRKLDTSIEGMHNFFMQLVKQSCAKTDNAMKILESYSLKISDIPSPDYLRRTDTKLHTYCKAYTSQEHKSRQNSI